jgi:hypothetical protein
MHIRPFFLLAIVSLLLPALAAANSLQFQATGIKIMTNGSKLTLNGTTLSRMNGLRGDSFRTLSFTTRPHISGTLAGGATFGNGGGIAIGGLQGGVIFRGRFSGSTTWTATWVAATGSNHQSMWCYSLSGPIAGLLSNGRPLSGVITETGDVPDSQEFTFHVDFHNGNIVIAVPEPGTVGMLGTGLAGVAGLAGRRKLKAM